MTDESVTSAAQMIQVNQSITDLRLTINEDASAVPIAEALRDNEKLEVLDLTLQAEPNSRNIIREQEWQAFLGVLRDENFSLRMILGSFMELQMDEDQANEENIQAQQATIQAITFFLSLNEFCSRQRKRLIAPPDNTENADSASNEERVIAILAATGDASILYYLLSHNTYLFRDVAGNIASFIPATRGAEGEEDEEHGDNHDDEENRV